MSWRNCFPWLGLVVVLCVPAARAQDLNACGTLENHYGPYDYRKERTGKLRIVETSHFTPPIESLAASHRGRVDIDAQNLNYTLRTAPNHHRALVATMRLGTYLGKAQIQDMDYSIECFLERAVRFAPDDTVARALYAQYLGKIKRTQLAADILDDGLPYAEDNPLSTYNFGLIYFELGEHEKALLQAHRAMALGLPNTELADMLKRAGKWRDPKP